MRWIKAGRRRTAYQKPMTTLATEPLRATDIRPAYPLIRSALPDLSPARWIAYARRAQRSSTNGIMVVRGARPFPVGLFCYRVERDLAQGRVLMAHHFVALELREASPITAALVKGLDRLARDLGCDAIHSVLHGPEDAMAACFEGAGHHRAASVYAKTLQSPEEHGIHAALSAPAGGRPL
ncbi:MAG TPA: hypothetical protein VKS60_07105 [Stellaceae bacterium]|nr:hypothetical protein [Stellaceae bacterium]